MNDWEALHDSKQNIESLRREIQNRKINWDQLLDHWEGDGLKSKVLAKAVQTPSSTYLEHVMASDLTTANPHRNCLFRASLDRMKDSINRNIRRDTYRTDTSDKGPTLFRDDKFSTDLAWSAEEGRPGPAMAEFSRFLMELSGECTLASSSDPLRDADLLGYHPNVPAMKHDRLIR
jgi:hypothetical protein